MKTIIEPSTILYFNNTLCEVIGIADGRTIVMEVLKDSEKDKCPHCEKPIETRIHSLEHSPQFQNSVKKVETIK